MQGQEHASITRVMRDHPTETFEHREEGLVCSMKSMVASVPGGESMRREKAARSCQPGHKTSSFRPRRPL